jgi:hypothetical protein
VAPEIAAQGRDNMKKIIAVIAIAVTLALSLTPWSAEGS